MYPFTKSCTGKEAAEDGRSGREDQEKRFQATPELEQRKEKHLQRVMETLVMANPSASMSQAR